MSRDFTYIDDLVEGIFRLMEHPPANPGSATGADDRFDLPVPFRAVNIGAAQPIGIEDFVSAIETALGRKARRKYLPMQPGDVRRTYASTELLRSIVGQSQSTPIDVGVRAFVEWYTKYRERGRVDEHLGDSI